MWGMLIAGLIACQEVFSVSSDFRLQFTYPSACAAASPSAIGFHYWVLYCFRFALFRSRNVLPPNLPRFVQGDEAGIRTETEIS